MPEFHLDDTGASLPDGPVLIDEWQAPLVYLAADDRLLVFALGIWAWDSIDGWHKALAE